MAARGREPDGRCRRLRVSRDAGFGQHRVLHEDRFFELQGSLAIEVEFIVSENDAQRLLERLSREKVRVCYAMIPARFGVIDTLDGPPAQGPAA